MLRSLHTSFISCVELGIVPVAFMLCCVGLRVVFAKENSTFVAVKNQKSSCFYDEIFLQSKTAATCAMNCHLDTQCVSASYSPDEGRCQLNSKLQCSTIPVMETGWMIFRHMGERGCNKSVGYTFYAGLRLCLKFYDAPVSKSGNIWKVCGNDGGRLVRIASSARQDLVALYLAEVGTNATEILVDGKREIDSQLWYWRGTEDLMTYTNWHPEEPNPGGNWRCIALNALWQFKWLAVRCYDDFKFLCEIPIGN